MHSKTLYLGIGTLITFCSLATTQAQVIDPLTGSLSEYTTYLVNDSSHGAGEGVSFTTSGSGLQASYVGTGAPTVAEQALLLAPATAFPTTFGVGDTLEVNAAFSGTTLEDFGLAISSSSPSVATVGNGWSSRASFDWASISVRPGGSGGTVRVNESISGTLTTAGGALSPALGSITGLYIDWVSTDVFNVGYLTSSGAVSDENITFANGSTIGSEIGFYGDLRGTGTVLGNLTNLTVVPEPSTLALSGMGFAGLFALLRRKK